jgi:DNA topoisomerase 2-associated protein PAT1
MSFFGFDATLPRDRGHQANAPGFAQPQDAFAGLSGRGDQQGQALVHIFNLARPAELLI